MAETVHLPESRDVSARALLIFAACLILFLAATLGVLALLFDFRPTWPLPGPAQHPNSVSPALQRQPVEEDGTYRRRKQEELRELRWADREGGFAVIPIEEAMKILAGRGMAVREKPPAPASGEEDECALLQGTVPRAPQAKNCGAAQ